MQRTIETDLKNTGRTWKITGEQKIYMVENPAAFSRLVEKYPDRTILCGNGQPKFSVFVLLDKLTENSTIYYAGDFDPEGLQIAQNLKKRYPEHFIFWKYKAEYYQKYKSEVQLDEKRIRKLDKIDLPELQEIKEAMQRENMLRIRRRWWKSMNKWEKFEQDCVEFLNKTYGMYARFTHKGGADSTVPDILVETRQGFCFYIEAKHSPAQCGQFVLLPDIMTQTFQYSKQNTDSINSSAQMIIEYMNQKFDDYRNAGTAGKEIMMPGGQEILQTGLQNIIEKRCPIFYHQWI